MKKVYEKAPAKIILIGEHAVVHGFPAITTTLNLHAGCEISQGSEANLHLVVPIFNIDEKLTWKELDASYERITQLFEKNQQNPSREIIQKIKEDNGALPKVIIAETFKYKNFVPNENIRVDGLSEIPTGGFGSSSAAGAAFIKALNKFFDFKLSIEEMISILIKAESKFQGYKVSGIDQIAVFLEGLTQFKKVDGVLEYDKINISDNFIEKFLIIESGRPENTTGEVVTKVGETLRENPMIVNSIFAKIHSLTNEMIETIKSKDRSRFFEIINEAGIELVKLGIVTADSEKLMNQLKSLGGFVKVSGAGAISGKGSGAFICFAADYEPIKKFLIDNNYSHYEVSLS